MRVETLYETAVFTQKTKQLIKNYQIKLLLFHYAIQTQLVICGEGH